MGDAGRYHGLAALSKANLRRLLIADTFGSQTAAARAAGRDRSTVTQVVGLRRRSRPLDAFLLARIRQKLGEQAAKLWAA